MACKSGLLTTNLTTCNPTLDLPPKTPVAKFNSEFIPEKMGGGVAEYEFYIGFW